MIDGPISSHILNAAASYKMSRKWIAIIGTSFNLGDTGMPGIGGNAATEPTLKDLTGPSNNSLLSEYKGALSTVPDDSSKLPESKHQDGNTTTATEPDEEPSKLEKVKKAVKDAWKTAKEGEIVKAVVQLGQDFFSFINCISPNSSTIVSFYIISIN